MQFSVDFFTFTREILNGKLLCVCVGGYPKAHNTSTWRRFDLDIFLTRRKQNIDKFLRLSTYFFEVISRGKKSALFRHTWFDVILMAKKSTSFQGTLIDVFSMSEKLTVLYIADSDKFEKDKKLWWFFNKFSMY